MRITKRSFTLLLLLGALIAAVYLFASKQEPVDSNQNAPVQKESTDELAGLLVGEPNAKRAMHELFGANAVVPQSLKGAATSEFAKLKYQQGADQMVSILLKSKRLDPQSGTYSDCHACGVALSAVDYAYRNGSWSKVSESIDFAEIGSWGEAEASDFMQIQQDIAENTTAFMFDSGWTGQGVATSFKIILALQAGKWRALGTIATGADNTGDCEDAPDPKLPNSPLKPCWENSGEIEVLSTSTNSYRDILVRMNGTRLGENGTVVPASNVNYSFAKSGEYLEVRTRPVQ